jgi:hypothetical protein
MNAPGGSITVRVRAIGGLVLLWANPSVADKDAAAGSSNSLPPLGVVSSVAPARQQVGTRASGDAEHLPSMDAAAAGHKFDEVN